MQPYCNYRTSRRGQLTLAQNSLPGIDFSHTVPVELKTKQLSCMFDSNDLHPKSPFGQYAFNGLWEIRLQSAILRSYPVPDFCKTATTRDCILSASKIPISAITDALGFAAPCSDLQS